MYVSQNSNLHVEPVHPILEIQLDITNYQTFFNFDFEFDCPNISRLNHTKSHSQLKNYYDSVYVHDMYK